MKPMRIFYLQRGNEIKSINDTLMDLMIPQSIKTIEDFSANKKIKKKIAA